jgi:DNA-3-methyladenine glycosylase II
MNAIQYFEYGAKERDALKSKDPTLGKAIDAIGHIYRQIRPDLFTALLHSIIGQQISTKAQKTVWARFQAIVGPITPQQIASIPAVDLQVCGTSMKKVSYIKEIATSVLEGSLDLATLQTMSDADVIKRLTQIKGVGVWTAEMLLIFSMQRMNVISRGDAAILRGLRMLYVHKEITPKQFELYQKRYSPYATVASLYLWQISHGTYAGLVDNGPQSKARKTADAIAPEQGRVLC